MKATKYIKLSDYAKNHSVTYKTAWNRYKAGKIPDAFMSETGSVLIPIVKSGVSLNTVAIYARVSSNENKANLDSQAERLTQYSIARGYQVVKVVKEVGSGVNDNRKKLQKLLSQEDWGMIVVEHKDRLTRFGFNYISTLLESQGRKIEVVNMAEDGNQDLMQDLVAIIYSFSARMYGLRRTKRKTEKIIKLLNEESETDD